MVKTSPSDAGGVGLIPGQGPEIPLALGPKNQDIKLHNNNNKKPSCIKKIGRNFSGPVVKNPPSGRGCGFDPCSGNQDPTGLGAKKPMGHS